MSCFLFRNVKQILEFRMRIETGDITKVLIKKFLTFKTNSISIINIINTYHLTDSNHKCIFVDFFKVKHQQEHYTLKVVYFLFSCSYLGYSDAFFPFLPHTQKKIKKLQILKSF